LWLQVEAPADQEVGKMALVEQVDSKQLYHSMY
jgi:hypothetical protein